MPGGGQRSQQGLGAGAQGLVLGLLVYEANGHAQGLGGAFHLLDGDAAFGAVQQRRGVIEHQHGGGAVVLDGVGMTNEQLSGALSKASAFSTGGDGASKVAGAAGQMLNAVMEQQAAGHDAHKAELEAGAKAHEAQVQQSSDVMQQMQDFIRDIRDKLSSIEQSRIETTRGIARNI